MNHSSLSGDEHEFWVDEDEGGLGGGMLVRYRDGQSVEHRAPLNDGLIFINAIKEFQRRLFVTSRAGLVEMDRQRPRYIHYLIETDPKDMALWCLKERNGSLWAAGNRGWVRFELGVEKVQEFRLDGAPSPVIDFDWFAGDLYVANESGVYRVSKERSQPSHP